MRRSLRGNALIETAMMMPLLILLLVGMVEIARLTYTYYTLHKTLYSLGRYLGTQQGANFCDDADAVVSAAKTFALTGGSDSAVDPAVGGLTADMIRVRIERYAADTDELGQCECSLSGCDSSQGGRAPDFIVVEIPDGYPILPRIPYLQSNEILFRPRVRVPFGGT